MTPHYSLLTTHNALLTAGALPHQRTTSPTYQVMSLTQEQLDALPAAEREQLQALQEELRRTGGT